MLREAVVMAAGEGRRLRPLTERWPKPVLPIDGRAVIATLARELRSAGVERAVVVVSRRGGAVERLLGDGGAFGLRLEYAEQPAPHGSADAVARGLGAGVELPCLVAGADTVFAAGDLARFASAPMEAAGAIAVRRVPPPSAERHRPVRVAAGRVVRVPDDRPGSLLGGAPLWVLGRAPAERLCRDARPHELARAFQAAIDDGFPVSAVEIGPTRDLTYPVDLVERNFPYLRALRE